MKDYFAKLKEDDEALKQLGRAIIDEFEEHLITKKASGSKVPCSDGLCKLVAEWYDQGWRIERTSCSCGGNWAWLRVTERGTLKMYGCVCHHVPDEKFA